MMRDKDMEPIRNIHGFEKQLHVQSTPKKRWSTGQGLTSTSHANLLPGEGEGELHYVFCYQKNVFF
jgi:hypothetical protein